MARKGDDLEKLAVHVGLPAVTYCTASGMFTAKICGDYQGEVHRGKASAREWSTAVDAAAVDLKRAIYVWERERRRQSGQRG